MLPELLKTAIEPFETPGRQQFRIQPTPIRINPAAALPFVMTINELCTNASKHGALTVPNGHVNIATKVNERGGTFHFKWSERGGPPVGEPSRRSFGMFLIEKASRSNSRARRECNSSRAAWSAKLMSRWPQFNNKFRIGAVAGTDIKRSFCLKRRRASALLIRGDQHTQRSQGRRVRSFRALLQRHYARF